MEPADALNVACTACLAQPGEACYSTSTDEPRLIPHRLRGLSAALSLVPCDRCRGLGWMPSHENAGKIK